MLFWSVSEIGLYPGFDLHLVVRHRKSGGIACGGVSERWNQ
jgi:hypothetical protein